MVEFNHYVKSSFSLLSESELNFGLSLINKTATFTRLFVSLQEASLLTMLFTGCILLVKL